VSGGAAAAGAAGSDQTDEGSEMRFEVPAGNALVFSAADGTLLPVPVTAAQSRTIETDAEG
jgi:hypothetical protein